MVWLVENNVVRRMPSGSGGKGLWLGSLAVVNGLVSLMRAQSIAWSSHGRGED